MPKGPSQLATRKKLRVDKRKSVNTALEWCVKNEKGYKAAVNEGIIPIKQGKSLELALASARKAAAACAAKADAPLQSAAAAAQERIKAIRETIDSRMVSHMPMNVSHAQP